MAKRGALICLFSDAELHAQPTKTESLADCKEKRISFTVIDSVGVLSNNNLIAKMPIGLAVGVRRDQSIIAVSRSRRVFSITPSSVGEDNTVVEHVDMGASLGSCARDWAKGGIITC